MEQVVNGGDLMLFQQGKTIALATSHKLTINAETVENSSKDNGGKWKSSLVKKMGWTLNSENLFVEKTTGPTQHGFGDLFDLMIARTPIDVVFAKASNADADEIPEGGWITSSAGTYTGKAIITSLDVNAPNDDNATYSVTLEGVGALVHKA